MKKKKVAKGSNTPKTVKQLTKKHVKVSKGKNENPNQLEDFDKILVALVKEHDNSG